MIKQYLSVAVELFNELHPDSPLLTKEDDKDIKENKRQIQIDRDTPNGVIPYSMFYLLSLNKKTVNAGLSLHMIIVDEAQEVNNDSFNTQVAPTTTATGKNCQTILRIVQTVLIAGKC